MIVDLLQGMKFPELRDKHLDSVIYRCWIGRFQQLEDLLEEAEAVNGTMPSSEAMAVSTEFCMTN